MIFYTNCNTIKLKYISTVIAILRHIKKTKVLVVSTNIARCNTDCHIVIDKKVKF